MDTLGAVACRLEHAVCLTWSAAEIGLALTRHDEIVCDPHHTALLDDVARHGFHAPIDGAALDLTMSPSGRIEGTNPYRRICGESRDRVLAWLRRAPHAPSPGQPRQLVVVCHCYGVPAPSVMHPLFGLDGIHADVVLNVMGHHQPGTYRGWPGGGLVSAQVSRFVENVRSAITGVRALVQWLRTAERYDRVVVVGYSLGGQLALHLAHAGDVDGAVLYCPVASVHAAVREIGWMRLAAPWIEAAIARNHGTDIERLFAMTDPLTLPLPIDQSRLHVVAQRHDALAPLHHVRLIREKYPRVRWTELPGTHLLPLGIAQLHRAVRDALGE